MSIEIIGGNAESVTGSCTKIKTEKHVYLFELGMIQEGHTPLENYKLNKKLLQKIRPKEIHFIIIGHFHQDHIGLIPSLYVNGNCSAKIIVPKSCKTILKEMWLDSAFINQRDIDMLNRLPNRHFTPYYKENDVITALDHIEEVESNEIVNISDELAIRYKNAGHILLSKQAELYINADSHVRKITFTSDIGNILTQESRVFVENFEPVTTSNIVIGECTYSDKCREINKKTFNDDINKIRTVIEQYCVENNHRVLIPSFSLDRTPYILWILYTLFKNNDNFNIPIIVDSPLANRLLDCYSEILEGEAKEKFKSMMEWRNLKRIVEAEDSKAAVSDKGAKCIVASSGMLSAGRSVKWAQSILPNKNDCILFIGYASEGTLAYKIKHEKENKTININGKPCKNKAQIYDLHSFSSHMQRNDLINYYKSINAEKIFLVHSNMQNKIEFKKDLEVAIAECLKTTKVVAVNKGTQIKI